MAISIKPYIVKECPKAFCFQWEVPPNYCIFPLGHHLMICIWVWEAWETIRSKLKRGKYKHNVVANQNSRIISNYPCIIVNVEIVSKRSNLENTFNSIELQRRKTQWHTEPAFWAVVKENPWILQAFTAMDFNVIDIMEPRHQIVPKSKIFEYQDRSKQKYKKGPQFLD